jgi:hypothetical protein
MQRKRVHGRLRGRQEFLVLDVLLLARSVKVRRDVKIHCTQEFVQVGSASRADSIVLVKPHSGWYRCSPRPLHNLSLGADLLLTFETRPTPRTENLVASAVQWAERIMRKIDGVYAGK